VAAFARGGGEESVLRTKGTVLVRPISEFGGEALGPWRPARKGALREGSYELKTTRGSWAHLQLPFKVQIGGKLRYVPGGCVDSRSLIRIDSYADSEIRVVRGKISLMDGRSKGRLPNHMG
jgi:hypothetical protein